VVKESAEDAERHARRTFEQQEPEVLAMDNRHPDLVKRVRITSPFHRLHLCVTLFDAPGVEDADAT
jgi:hypothetical protein